LLLWKPNKAKNINPKVEDAATSMLKIPSRNGKILWQPGKWLNLIKSSMLPINPHLLLFGKSYLIN